MVEGTRVVSSTEISTPNDYMNDLLSYDTEGSPPKLAFNFSPAPIYCISFLCIGDILGYANSTSTELSTLSTKAVISTSLPTVHALAAPKSETVSPNGQENFENLVRAALYFLNCFPGALFLIFMTLGE